MKPRRFGSIHCREPNLSRQPPSRRRRGGAGSRQRLITLLSILPWALLLFQYLFVLPHYDRLFRQFHFTIDQPTSVLLKISSWVVAHVLAAFLIAFALMTTSVVLSALAQSIGLSRRRRIWVLLLTFGIPCLLFVMTWVGVLLAHRRLIEGLQG